MMINPENSSRVVTTYKVNKANAVSDFLAKVRKWRKLFQQREVNQSLPYKYRHLVLQLFISRKRILTTIDIDG